MPTKGVVDQKRIMEGLLAKGIEGIAVSPVDAENQTPFLNEVAANSKLITQDADAPKSKRLVYIGTNNYKAGRALGKLVKEALPEGGEVIIFVGRLEQLNARQRRQGVIDELLEKPEQELSSVKFDAVDAKNLTAEGSKYTILDTRTDNFDKAKAKSNAEDAITKYENVKCMVGLFAYNPPACIDAIKEANKAGEIKVCGFDEQDALLQAIKDGNAHGTISQQPWEYGYESVKMLKNILDGKQPETSFHEVPFLVVTKDNIDEFWAKKRKWPNSASRIKWPKPAHRFWRSAGCVNSSGVRALHEVALELHQGEVLALIGENGAGKSTLMKILAGVQPADSGEYLIESEPVRFQNVRDAMAAGVALIHQELNLAANLDLAANIFLGREPNQFGFFQNRNIHDEAAKFLKRVGLDLPTDTLVGNLPIGKQQLVEIAKALSCNARVLIMDEPTSSLSQTETETLFEVVHDLRRQGISIIYISHRLGEVKELADRVTVFRDGENAGDLAKDEIYHDAMVRLMVGRDLLNSTTAKSIAPAKWFWMWNKSALRNIRIQKFHSKYTLAKLSESPVSSEPAARNCSKHCSASPPLLAARFE